MVMVVAVVRMEGCGIGSAESTLSVRDTPPSYLHLAVLLPAATACALRRPRLGEHGDGGLSCRHTVRHGEGGASAKPEVAQALLEAEAAAT